LISVSLSGQINFFGEEQDDMSNTPRVVIAGHQKTVTSLELDDKAGIAYSAGFDGRVVQTDLKSGERNFIVKDPKAFKDYAKQSILHLALSPDGKTLTTIFTNGDMFFNSTEKMIMDVENIFKLGGAPRCCAYSKLSHLIAAGTHRSKVFLFKDGKHWETIDTVDEPRSMDISHDDKKLVVGGSKGDLYFYDLDDMKADPGVLKSPRFLNRIPIRLKFNKDSTLLATLDDNKAVWIWNVKDSLACADPEPINMKHSYKGYHSASLADCDWNDAGALVTVGQDAAIIVWPGASEGASKTFYKLENAHKSGITRVKFLPGGNELLTCSCDASLRLFQIRKKEEEQKSNIF